ncbi:uncharacterized protein [Mytilus edulis]|uniref:uncharacterized protein n=1 Tax=Mytilus edulis TaxID=6550 RepID=UPI0039EEDD1E
MASYQESCDICVTGHPPSIAVTWCHECVEKLCDKCSHRHRLSSVTSTHSIFTMMDYEKLPDIIRTTKLSCKEHSEKLKMYCCDHELPLCRKCILSTHRNCENTAILTDAAKNVKTSTSMYLLYRGLKDVTNNLSKAAIDREHNLTNISADEDRIKQNMSLNRDRSNISNELALISKKYKMELKEIIIELQKREVKMLDLEKGFTYINNYATDIHAFVCMLEMKEIVHEEEIYLNSIYSEGTLDNINISLSSSRDKNTFAEKEIIVRKSATLVKIAKEEDTQGQIIMQRASAYDNIKLEMTDLYSIERKGDITGCCVLPGGKIVLADSSGELIIQEINGLSVTIPTNRGIFDVCAIDVNTVAYTNGMSCSLHIIDLKKNTVIKSTSTTNACCGITYRDGKIIFSVKNDGIFTTNRKLSNPKRIFEDKLPWGSYVTTSEDKIFFTNSKERTVAAINSDYQIIWKLPFEEYKPFGIVVDSKGNVYVTGHIFLIVIASDGNRSKRLDGRNDGLYQPWPLAYDAENNCIIVANLTQGPVLVYSII